MNRFYIKAIEKWLKIVFLIDGLLAYQLLYFTYLYAITL